MRGQTKSTGRLGGRFSFRRRNGLVLNHRMSLSWKSARIVVLLAVCTLGASVFTAANSKAATPPVRWAEGEPGCTFDRGDDGKYRYGLWKDDVGMVVAIDSQELQKVHRRIEPMVGVLVTIRYRGKNSLDFRPDHISLEFVSHSQVTHETLDPDDLSNELQSKADSFSDETEREITKHPEKKDQKETFLQAYEKDLTEMLEFLSTRSLRAAKLNPGLPEASGWLFFSTKSKWIGDWKKQEQFVLRIPLENQVYEIPFALPPTEGDLILRKRDN